MDKVKLYEILRDITASAAKGDSSITPLPEIPPYQSLVSDLGLDLVTLPEILSDLESRFRDKDLGRNDILSQESLNSMTLGEFMDRVLLALRPGQDRSLVVYVDDEEENLFIFKRKYGKRLDLKTFTDPVEALSFIRTEPEVGLVITDEVMPKLSGNQLCDEVHKVKPAVKFILITGNPNNDSDLMYRALRQNRFYEFINKPVDLEGKGEEYFNMIQGLLSFDW